MVVVRRRGILGERIAFVGQKVEHCEHALQAPFGLKARAAFAQLPLGSHEPLGDRRLGKHEAARDLPRVEPAHHLQGERHLHLFGE